jgi:Tfp pilus assembly protein PilP
MDSGLVVGTLARSGAWPAQTASPRKAERVAVGERGGRKAGRVVPLEP